MDFQISVIVPVFDLPIILLRRCIDSILNQTISGIEIVIISDGANSTCNQVIEDYHNQYSDRIQISIFPENHGVSFAKNHGISIARGQYLMFVDADDYIDSGWCQRLLNGIETSGAEIAFSVIAVHELDGRVHIDYKKPYGCMQGSLWRKDFILYNNLKFDENLKRWEDTVFKLVGTKLARRVCYLDDISYEFLHYCKRLGTLSDYRP